VSVKIRYGGEDLGECEDTRAAIVYALTYASGYTARDHADDAGQTVLVDFEWLDSDGEWIEASVPVDPSEPDCDHEDGHKWAQDGEAWGVGAGVGVVEVCSHCALRKTTLTNRESCGVWYDSIAYQSAAEYAEEEAAYGDEDEDEDEIGGAQ